ncbi:chain length determinant protein EpsF [Massilia antarctica]|uniref:chain length determinant protein EpsF n=1 Tax=Massilia antarctica TaxID=2765360 RepID=UPI0006BB94A2|nr:chain length determinant protein EpsF [Massilia sp. H27-R4]MCY0914742.1 chain length determinant protein EpsF [Massilia sp. H27-R4]CUI08222.1 Tyrosine-protein kinase Wzc [Janthinobacterium sp. CG23_2]CUU32008.1 Tyrosine-protein kinase Wzc [Janthinobacterium sp. CG23_2]
MNLSQFLLILYARKYIILATLLVTVTLTLMVSLSMPKTYQSTASVLLNYKGVDPLTGMAMPSQLLPGYMATQIDIISSKNVAGRVVDQLKMADNPTVVEQFKKATGGRGTVRDWLADLLIHKLDVVPSRESSVVEINFKGADPQFVAAVANAFAEEYQKLSIELKVEPMKKAAAYFNEQTKMLRGNVEAAQSRLSKYQQDNGIVSVDNRLDVESNRLNDLSAQLVAAQGQAMEANSRQGMAQGSRGADSPDVAANPLVQNLKVQLAGAESRLADVGQRLGQNHPQYLSIKAEVDKISANLASQQRSASSSVGNNAAILQQREASVRAALAAQKAKVLELNRSRDELGVLVKDVESAQRAFDVTSQRFSQTRIEGASEQSDIAVLNPATAPLGANGPRVMLNTMLSAFLGVMLGLGFALLAEMIDRRVRSETDMAEVLQMPVLGVIDWTAPKRRRYSAINSLLPRRLRLG